MAVKKNSGWFGRNLGIIVFVFLGLILFASIWLILENSITIRPAEDDSLIDCLSVGSAAPEAVETPTAGEKSCGRLQAKVAELVEAYVRANIDCEALKPADKCVEISVSLRLDKKGGQVDREKYFARYNMKTGEIIFHNKIGPLRCAETQANK